MDRYQEILRNSVQVFSREKFVILKVCSPYVLRLLGTSCDADVPLYTGTKAISLFIGGAEFGVVAISLSSEDKSFSAVGMFRVTSRDSKVFVELRENITGKYLGDINDSGLDTHATFMGVKKNYRVPQAFWGDTKEWDDREKVAKFVSGTLEYHYKILRDGNVFCRFIIGQADVNDLEAAHLEYKMEDFGFRKQMAKEVVGLRQQTKKVDEDLKVKNLECQAKQEEINNLNAKLERAISSLVYIKSVLLRSWAPWWKKLTYIGTVFDPKHCRFLGTYLK